MAWVFIRRGTSRPALFLPGTRRITANLRLPYQLSRYPTGITPLLRFYGGSVTFRGRFFGLSCLEPRFCPRLVILDFTSFLSGGVRFQTHCPHAVGVPRKKY